MKTSSKLMEERGALVEELETILNGASAEARDFTDAENERQDSIHNAIVDLDEAIQRAKNNDAVFAAAAGNAVSASEAKEVNEIRGRFSLTKAIADLTNKGQLDGVEAEMVQEGRSEMQRVGQSARGNITIPSFLMRSEARANETYTVNDSNGQAQGDATRGIDHAPIVEGLRPVPLLERIGGTVIQATGDLVLPSLPNGDATTTDEGVAVNNLDGDFGNTKLQPKRFAMRMDLTRQMLNQSDPALDAVIARDMSTALANALDRHAIGTNLFASSNITDGTVVDAENVKATSYADMVAHEGGFLSQDPAGQNLVMLMDPTMAAHLKSVELSTGSGLVLNTGNTVLGYDVHASTSVQAQTVAAKSYFSGISDADDTCSIRPIIFVDPSDLFIAQFGGLDITVDAYSLAHNGVIRLIADMYANANVRRAGSVRVLGGLTANSGLSAVS